MGFLNFNFQHLLCTCTPLYIITPENGVASLRVEEVDWFEEGEFDSALAAREGHGNGLIDSEAVVGEVVLKGAGGAFGGLGRVGRAFEVTVGFEKGVETGGHTVRFGKPVDVVRNPGGFHTRGVGCTGVKMHGLIAYFPVLDEFEVGLLGAGLERRHDGAVEDSGKGGAHSATFATGGSI